MAKSIISTATVQRRPRNLLRGVNKEIVVCSAVLRKKKVVIKDRG